jgi:hypothetical protein
VIGTDSAMFDKSVDNISSFNLASAERIDILIKIKPDQFPLKISKLYLVCWDAADLV